MNLENEDWKFIPRTKNYYMISNYGRVLSVRWMRILKPRLNGGYWKINLITRDGYKCHQIAREVAKAFIRNPNRLPQVNHIDGNKQNNHVSNLEWVTAKENMRHAIDTGLRVAKKGTESHFARLTERDVREIRRLANTGKLHTEIAEQYRVSSTNIGYIVNFKRWKHI